MVRQRADRAASLGRVLLGEHGKLLRRHAETEAAVAVLSEDGIGDGHERIGWERDTVLVGVTDANADGRLVAGDAETRRSLDQRRRAGAVGQTHLAARHECRPPTPDGAWACLLERLRGVGQDAVQRGPPFLAHVDRIVTAGASSPLRPGSQTVDQRHIRACPPQQRSGQCERIWRPERHPVGCGVGAQKPQPIGHTAVDERAVGTPRGGGRDLGSRWSCGARGHVPLNAQSGIKRTAAGGLEARTRNAQRQGTRFWIQSMRIRSL